VLGELDAENGSRSHCAHPPRAPSRGRCRGAAPPGRPPASAGAPPGPACAAPASAAACPPEAGGCRPPRSRAGGTASCRPPTPVTARSQARQRHLSVWAVPALAVYSKPSGRRRHKQSHRAVATKQRLKASWANPQDHRICMRTVSYMLSYEDTSVQASPDAASSL